MKTQELERNRQPMPPRAESADLSAEITRAVDRYPGDRVRCRRVYGDNYRCNWLAVEKQADAGRGLALETYNIRQSKFLRVTRTAAGLHIEDLTIDR
jgi:hypothetical protein